MHDDSTTTAGTNSKQLEPRKRRGPLLRFSDLVPLLKACDRNCRDIIQEPWFPAAIVLSPRVRLWSEDEVLEAIVTRAPRQTVHAEPEELAKARQQKSASRSAPPSKPKDTTTAAA